MITVLQEAGNGNHQSSSFPIYIALTSPVSYLLFSQRFTVTEFEKWKGPHQLSSLKPFTKSVIIKYPITSCPLCAFRPPRRGNPQALEAALSTFWPVLIVRKFLQTLSPNWPLGSNKILEDSHKSFSPS